MYKCCTGQTIPCLYLYVAEFLKEFEECNMADTSTSSKNILYIVHLDSSTCVYTKTNDLSDRFISKTLEKRQQSININSPESSFMASLLLTGHSSTK